MLDNGVYWGIVIGSIVCAIAAVYAMISSFSFPRLGMFFLFVIISGVMIGFKDEIMAPRIDIKT